MEGIVTKAVNGFFDVFDGEMTRLCRARGVFRKRGITVLAGDVVSFDPMGAQEGVITEVKPRKTSLVRPPIANVTQALLVFSVVSPDFQHHLLDRLLVNVSAEGLRPVIVLTKCDLLPSSRVEEAMHPYTQAGYSVFPVATKQNQGLEPLREQLTGHVTVFAGPSGVGKSTLANGLAPGLGLKMGEISEKLGRGKHTTRHVALYPLGPETYIADAPGFSQLDIFVPSSDIRLYFPEFAHAGSLCAYRGCLHIEEEDCAVQQAVEQGKIARIRYESYTILVQETREKEERRY